MCESVQNGIHTLVKMHLAAVSGMEVLSHPIIVLTFVIHNKSKETTWTILATFYLVTVLFQSLRASIYIKISYNYHNTNDLPFLPLQGPSHHFRTDILQILSYINIVKD